MLNFSKLIVLLLVVLSPAVTGLSAEPMLRKTNIFAAGEADYALYRIPGVVVTAKGTLLAYCEARKSSRGDWGTIDVMLRRSTDGGQTWTPMRKIVEVDPETVQQNPVALAQLWAWIDTASQLGTAHFFERTFGSDFHANVLVPYFWGAPAFAVFLILGGLLLLIFRKRD